MKTDWVDIDEQREKHQATRAYTEMVKFFETVVLEQDSFVESIDSIRREFNIEVEEGDGYDWLVPNNNFDTKLIRKTQELCKRYRLPRGFAPILVNYIYHNEIKYSSGLDNAMCAVFSGDKEYPVNIRINPYADEKDLIDFIKNVYKTQIAPLQNAAKEENVRMGAIWKKTCEVRNSKIIEMSKTLTPNQIVDNLPEEIDVKEVRRIIAERKKQRQEL